MPLRRALAVLLLATTLLAALPTAPARAALPGISVTACSKAPSLTVPPDTIRVLRTGRGVVEVVPFKLYVYRTHVAEFWSEHLSKPYTDALLGVGAVAIKQNAWLHTRLAHDWWGMSSTTSTQRRWVEEDYADDRALNGSAGDPAAARQTRATNHAAWALRMRIRFGSDRQDDGVGGLLLDPATKTYTAPLEQLDETGKALPITAESPRSCFDVTDHPSWHQYYTKGGIYEPGYVSGTRSNARYNAAVNATWAMTIWREYEPGDWRPWRPGFYGSFAGTSTCLLPPAVGDTGLQMRHPTQPSQWRGSSFFPMNADSCARTHQLSVEQLLRASFFSWSGSLVAGAGTSSIADDRYQINALTPLRIVSPAADLTGDGRGDLIAAAPNGSLAIVGGDPRLDAVGRVGGIAPGHLLLGTGETLVDRLVARTGTDGSVAVSDLRTRADGGLTILAAPVTGGVLTSPVVLIGPVSPFTAGATLRLLAADATGDGVDELFITERIADPIDPTRATLRIHRIGVAGSTPALVTEMTGVGADARSLLADLTGDGIADLVTAWREADGTLSGSVAVGSGAEPAVPFTLGTASTPGALLWPVPITYTLVADDLDGDGRAELTAGYLDRAQTAHLVRLELDTAADGGAVVSPDLVFTPESEPVVTTTVRSGEGSLAKVAARTKIPLAQLAALNAGPMRLETIRRADTYAKLAVRTKRSEACLRTMNSNKRLYRGQTVRVPLGLCVTSTSSVLRLGTPIRIRPAETDFFRAGDTAASIAARATAMGLAVGAEAIALLNLSLDLATALPNTPVRIRAPWAPVVRSVGAPGSITTPTGTLAWRAPAEVWTGAAATPLPGLLVREWTGDGVADLLLAGPAGAAGTTLVRLAWSNGRLVAAETIARAFAVAGWMLR
jgi:hypothetical protein